MTTRAQRKAFRELLDALAANDPDPVVKAFASEFRQSFTPTLAQLQRLDNAARNTSLSQSARLHALHVLINIFTR